MDLILVVLLPLIPTISGMVVPPDHPLIFKEGYSPKVPLPKGLEEGDIIGNPVVAREEDDDDEDSNIPQCYEAQQNTGFVYQTDWKVEKTREVIPMRYPADFVVILDGGEGCHSKSDCLQAVQNEANYELWVECMLRENFYIGGDGNVYEGRGWSVAPFRYLNGLRNQSLTVKFLGSHESQLPTYEALQAFKSFLFEGVWLGTLSPQYKIVSIRQLSNTDAHIGGELELSVQEWTGWVDSTVPMSRWEYMGPGTLNLVFRRDWNASEALTEFRFSIKPTHYVLLNNVHERCHTRKGCVDRMRDLQKSQSTHYGDLMDNFYIGEDGNVYEGRGWEALPHWHVEGMRDNYVSVSLLGKFHTEVPSYRAIGAFKELIHTGIRLGKLSSDFKLTSLSLVYDDEAFLGAALKRYVQKWTPWEKEFDLMSAKDRMDANLVPLLTRERLELGHNPTAESTPILHPNMPVNYVIINEGGEFCFNVSGCKDAMNLEWVTYSGTYGDILDSFYVGSDGMVYEGRGWKKLPPFHLKHLKNSYITVKFLGTFTKTKPNNLTLQAFHSFLQLGVDLGKISPSYQIYSLRHIYNDSSFLGDALSEYVEGLSHWSNEMTDVNDDNERESQGLLPIVSRDEWEYDSFNETFHEINGSVQYVFVGETGKICVSRTQCIDQIQEEKNRRTDLYGSLTDHFFVGDDGSVYEGLGWVRYSLDHDNETQEGAISVRFFGQFHKNPPSRLAMSAFHRLIKYGLNTGKLSEDYKIVSNRHLCNCTEGLGQALQRDMEKWVRYSDDVILLNTSDSLPYISPFMIVPNPKWETHPRGSSRVARDVRPAAYVVVSDAGDRCFDREQCLSQVSDLPTDRDDYENFFVGEDGRSYEASGWRKNIYGEYFCPNCNVIFIGFLGKFNYDVPSSNAIGALNYLVQSGIRSGKILPNYKLVSIRQICGNCSLVGDSLNIAIRSWKNWNALINIRADCAPFERKIHRHVWDIHVSPLYNHYNYYTPFSFDSIFIDDEEIPCNTPEECTYWLRSRYSYGNFKYNFFVGEDGNVYEGIGWEYSQGSAYNRPTTSTLYVLFIGDLNFSSKEAIFAFKKLIVNKGIENGHLNSSYTISLSNPGNEEVFNKFQLRLA